MRVLLSVFPFIIYKNHSLLLTCSKKFKLIEEAIKIEKWLGLLLNKAESKILFPMNLSFQKGGIHVCG